MSQSTPAKHDGRAVLFPVAELLVNSSAACRDSPPLMCNSW